MGGTSMEEMWGAGFAGSSPPFLGWERAAVDVDVGLRSAAALATMRPVLLLRVLKKAARRSVNREVCDCACPP